MREAANIAEVASFAPEYLGFIFYRKSPRYVGEGFVLPKGLDGIKTTGVFVNESPEQVIRLASRLGLDAIQLHGNETPDDLEKIRKAGFEVIKVFRVDEAFDFRDVDSYRSVADYFLFDTKGQYYGGNAIPFDWSLLKRYDQQVPFFLSGGLSPENLHMLDELNDMNIYALDFNSGVEVAPGLKDITKIAQVFDKLRPVQNR